MLFENRTFANADSIKGESDEHVFRFCKFEGFDADGMRFEGSLEWSRFSSARLYWTSFNTARLHEVTFEDCVFPGVSLRSCVLTSCSFVRCGFVVDNFGGSCVFDDCVLAECLFERCTFEHRKGRKEPVFTKTNRLYGCTITACTDFDGDELRKS